MPECQVSLKVAPDRTSYLHGDNVLITIWAKKKNRAAAQEPVKLYVFAPSGEKVYRSRLSADSLGRAMGMYRIGKNMAAGRYYIEAHSTCTSVALASFFVLHRKQSCRKLLFSG